MPPKTVTCCICGKEVMKAQTLQVQEGRACRFHEGVQDFSKMQQNIQKEKLENSIQKMEKKTKPKQYSPSNEDYSNLKPMCVRCGKIGISLSDFYLQCAVAMEKCSLTNERINFFELGPQLLNHIPEEFRTPIIPVNITNREDVVNQIKFKFRDAAQFLKMVTICPKCLKELKLNKNFEDQFMKNKPNLDLKTVYLFGELMKPELQKIAKEQLKQEGVEIK